MSSPRSSSSIAIQSQVLSSEVKKMKREEKDLIPRKCSTNLPARCRNTIGLPTGFPCPVSVSVAAPRPEFFHLTYILRMCQSNTSQAGRLGGPLLRSLAASLHHSRSRKRSRGKSGRLGWRIPTPTWWGCRGGRDRGGRAEAAATPAGPPPGDGEPGRLRATAERGERGQEPGSGRQRGRAVQPPARCSGASLRSSRRRRSRGPAAERPSPPAAAEGGRT